MEWSPSKLIRVEGGGSSITKVDLDALLTKYGVTSESHRERLHNLNRGAKKEGWWDSYKDEVNPGNTSATWALRLEQPSSGSFRWGSYRACCRPPTTLRSSPPLARSSRAR